jgi:transposase
VFQRRRSALSMRFISEVLRLAAQGRSQREISIGTGLAKTTVNRHLRRAEEAGLSWPLPADLDEAALEARLFLAGELRGEPKAGRPEPDWEAVHGWRPKSGVKAADEGSGSCYYAAAVTASWTTSSPVRSRGGRSSS